MMYINSDDLMAEEIKNKGEYQHLLEDCKKNNKSVPDEIECTLIKRAIAKAGTTRILIDAFPKGEDGAKVWEKQMGSNVILECVLFFECSLASMEARQKKSGAKPEDIRKAMEYYNKEYKTVLRFYQNTGQVQKISTEGEEAEIFGHTKRLVERFLASGMTQKWGSFWSGNRPS